MQKNLKMKGKQMTKGHVQCQCWTAGLLVNCAPFPNSGWFHGMWWFSFQCDQSPTYNIYIRIACGIENRVQHPDIETICSVLELLGFIFLGEEF